MKTLAKLAPILIVAMLLTSCGTVRVAADYDTEVSFDDFKTFAFFKPGIDKAEISDLDKRRILRAIETELTTKGYTKSENPDLLISIFTESNQRVDIYNNTWGMGAWGWGMGPRWGWGAGWGGNQVSTTTEGVLFIDIINAKTKSLVWQGSGKGRLITGSPEKKEARIKTFVSEMLMLFPPEKK